MLGNFAVGKSSLVRRYVTGVFDASYQTTVGVKIDTCQIELADARIKMILWDLAGQATITPQSIPYLQGMSAYLLVADGTRPQTLRDAEQTHRDVQRELGALPFVLLLNKHDLSDQWRVDDEWLQQRRASGWTIFITSALSGEQVPMAFEALAQGLAE